MLREELQLLQEPGSYVGEVVKVMGKSKVLVKVITFFSFTHTIWVFSCILVCVFVENVCIEVTFILFNSNFTISEVICWKWLVVGLTLSQCPPKQ